MVMVHISRAGPLPVTPHLYAATAMGPLRARSATSAVAVGAFLLTALAGCGPSPVGSATPPVTAAPPSTAAPVGSGTGAGTTVIVEPDAGIGPIDALLAAPHHQLDLVMYELVDPTAVSILVGDAARGVDVRVVLDQNRERESNTPAFDELAAHGVHVVWAPAAFEATHEKAFVVDPGTPGAEAVVMTLNLTSRYYADTRDVAVVDRDPTDVDAVEATFAADDAAAAAGTGAAPEASPAPDLVWSPGAAPALLTLIASATRTLDVESEEMSDTEVVDALAAAARRGVAVTVVLTEGIGDGRELAELAAAGVAVRLLPDRAPVPYIHAKVVVADDARVFVGSENFSTASLDRNRELGVVLADPVAAGRLAAVIAADANRSGG
jgi:cardiolipin synthase